MRYAQWIGPPKKWDEEEAEEEETAEEESSGGSGGNVSVETNAAQGVAAELQNELEVKEVLDMNSQHEELFSWEHE